MLKPKTIVILGLGCVMCTIFVTIGIIHFIGSGGGGAGAGGGSGGAQQQGRPNPYDYPCVVMNKQAGEPAAKPPCNENECERECGETEAMWNSRRQAAGLPPAPTQSGEGQGDTPVSCRIGETEYNGTCYPICDNYGSGGRGFHWSPIGGGCGVSYSDWGSPEHSDPIKHMITSMDIYGSQFRDDPQPGNCDKRFTKDQSSPTGYSVCVESTPDAAMGVWHTDTVEGGPLPKCVSDPPGGAPTYCIPTNALEASGTKIPLCGTNQWMGGSPPSESSGTSTWVGQKASTDTCKCPSGSTETSGSGGAGGDWVCHQA